LQLRAELAQHGLAEGLAAEAIEQAESDQDWVSRALELAQRRLRGADPKDLREQRRLADFLLRRGFPNAIVRSVLARIGSELELEDPGP
jgi:regulatory protein